MSATPSESSASSGSSSGSPAGAASTSGTRLRAELLEIRQQLVDSREELRAQHDRGLTGVKVCAKLTAAADAAVMRLFNSALAEQSNAAAEDLRSRVVLIAHGGYGRRQLAPYSDIDLMILYQGRAKGSGDADVEQLARRLTQDIFDVGLQLGQSLRTVDEAINMARTDAVICTSLIESRRLIGDEALFDLFKESFEKVVRRRDKAMSATFVAARKEERQKYGETVYLLEPNIKRSRGALRDLHLLRWLWYAHTGICDLDRLHMKGVLSNFDHRRLSSSQEFLLRVRNDSHFHAGKAQDALTRGEQMRLAEKLDYHGREGLRPVEQFMRDYFRHAGHVWFLAARITELTTPQPAVQRVLGAMFARNIEQDYRLTGREINATQNGRAKLTNNLDEALRLVDLARMCERRIGQDTWYLVYRAAPEYQTGDPPGSELPATTVARFLEILDNPRLLGDLLHRLHDLGVLEKLIPEYSHARCLLQFNQYHSFTVDEHCINCVEQATRFADRQDQLGDVYRGLTKKKILHLALLIHDLGKGHEEDHSVLGEKIAEQVAARFGLWRGETQQLKFLVRRHLWMSHMAFRRDTNDPELIEAFANEIRQPDTLTMLYLLTCADLAGVGPGVMNDWKVDVLTDLYSRAMEILQPEHRVREQVQRQALRDAAWKCVPTLDQGDSWYRRQFDALPQTFFATRPPEKVVEALDRLRSLTGGQGTAWGTYTEENSTIEFIAGVSAGTGRGVFSAMAGSISAASLQILAAETTILDDDLLLLRYVAQPPAELGEPTPERIDKIANQMIQAIDDETPPTFPKKWGADAVRSQAELTNLPHEVRLDSSLTEHWLIVEIFTIDRLGLLYKLARAVHDLDLIIRFAKISTNLDQVIDVFYVCERDGTKPSGEERLGQIRERLMEIISPEA